MRVNDIFAIENGEHIRILLCSEEQCYAVSCHHFRMPFPLSTHELEAMKSVSTEAYTIFAVDEDISTAQRRERDRRFALIKPLLDNTCICDKPHRNEIVKQVVGEHGVSRRTVLQYLWKYWVYQNKNILLPTGRASAKAHKLTADEKAIRWALNKYYYTPQKQSLQTAYKMMLRAKFCDAQGKLKPDYPTFWQFRYFFRKNRDPISETISRQGLKAYQRNHRPFTGSVCDYAHTIGVYMTDATVADIYIVSRLSRKPIGRPVIYTMVDTDLYARNVDLFFLKEPHINTETYRQTIQRQINAQLQTGSAATDNFVSSVIAALNQYTADLAAEQIRLAFAQAQKEVDDLRQRTREGMLTAKLNGKQIGQVAGRKLIIKKTAPCKELIVRYSKDFGGTLSDAECIKLIGIARNTYYKYKRELREQSAGLPPL